MTRSSADVNPVCVILPASVSLRRLTRWRESLQGRPMSQHSRQSCNQPDSHPLHTRLSEPTHATERFKGFVSLIAFVFLPYQALCAEPASSQKASMLNDKQRQELISIMKEVNFVPQLGADKAICKTLYDNFKKQTNIEYVQPIVRAESYDDPALKPYRDKCPSFDFRKSLSVPANQDTTGWTDEEWESLGTPTYGIDHFKLFRVDIDNDRNNGKEFVFYYQGARTIVKRLPYGKPMTEEEYVDPAARSYQVLDLTHCKKSSIGGVGFKTGSATLAGSLKIGDAGWNRSGIIRYKGQYAIFLLQGNEKQGYFYLNFNLYSVRLKRIVPMCTYHKAR